MGTAPDLATSDISSRPIVAVYNIHFYLRSLRTADMRPFLHHQDISVFSFLLISYTNKVAKHTSPFRALSVASVTDNQLDSPNMERKENSQAAVR